MCSCVIPCIRTLIFKYIVDIHNSNVNRVPHAEMYAYKSSSRMYEMYSISKLGFRTAATVNGRMLSLKQLRRYLRRNDDNKNDDDNNDNTVKSLI